MLDNTTPNTSIWHDGLIEDYLPQVGATQVFAVQSGSTQISTSQISSAQVSSAQTHISQGSIGQISFTQINSNQISSTQVSPTQVSSSENSNLQVGITQVGSIQLGIFQDTHQHISPTQISFTQISPCEVQFGQTSSTQINPTQIESAQISILNFKFNEAAFSTQIPSDQLFSTNTRHTTSLQSLFAINNTALTLWNTYLQSTTPLNLNIEIQDLPTGQLAEAQVTQFSANGTPTGGTLYLDIDANGLGWFIDPTPWENSEFAQTLTDNAYRTTPNSIAYGHYDLLTTILHETAYLQGIISGYSNYDRSLLPPLLC